MPKLLFIMAIPFIVAWTVSTWWKIRSAKSERERSLLSRSSMGAMIGSVLAVVALVLLPVKGQAVALPIAIVAGVIYVKSTRAARERIRAEEARKDPAARAKRTT
jgi:hypothetical protein